LVDKFLQFLYNIVTELYKTQMTVTTNEFGQQNMFAKEPTMYISDEDAIKYGMMTHNERAELANGRWAMMGIITGLASYAITGNLFFGLA
jgi:hypothetical protein